MAILIEIVCLFSCIILAYQDFSFRRIHIGILFLFAGSGWTKYAWYKNVLIPEFLLSNLLIIAIICIMILVIFRRRKEALIDQKLGKGDIVMWLALAFWMPTEHFILFFCLSTWILCLIFLPLQRLGKIPRNYPVPLAGAQALFFLVFRHLEKINMCLA